MSGPPKMGTITHWTTSIRLPVCMSV